MKKFILSNEAYRVYSSFYVNLAAATFLTIFVSKDSLDLTARLIGSTILLYSAVVLERKLK